MASPASAATATNGRATRRCPCLSMSRPSTGPATASTASPTDDTAPASANDPRRSLTMTMTATPNIAPPTRARAVPAMNGRAPGTANNGR